MLIDLLQDGEGLNVDSCADVFDCLYDSEEFDAETEHLFGLLIEHVTDERLLHDLVDLEVPPRMTVLILDELKRRQVDLPDDHRYWFPLVIARVHNAPPEERTARPQR